MRAGSGIDAHVARVLGIDAWRARVLLEGVRRRKGRVAYGVRLAAFLVATTLGRHVPARALRERAVRGLLNQMLERPADVRLFLGLTDAPPVEPCRGMPA